MSMKLAVTIGLVGAAIGTAWKLIVALFGDGLYYWLNEVGGDDLMWVMVRLMDVVPILAILVFFIVLRMKQK